LKFPERVEVTPLRTTADETIAQGQILGAKYQKPKINLLGGATQAVKDIKFRAIILRDHENAGRFRAFIKKSESKEKFV